MGILSKRERNALKQLRKKNEEHNNNISKEINEIIEDINEDFQENHSFENKFSDFAKNIKSKLSNEELKLLEEFTNQIHKLNYTSKKSLHAIRELAREQKKASRETLLDYEEFLQD
jgi:hypothetical protein